MKKTTETTENKQYTIKKIPCNICGKDFHPTGLKHHFRLAHNIKINEMKKTIENKVSTAKRGRPKGSKISKNSIEKVKLNKLNKDLPYLVKTQNYERSKDLEIKIDLSELKESIVLILRTLIFINVVIGIIIISFMIKYMF